MDDIPKNNKPVPSGMLRSSSEDYKVSLIVVVPATIPEPTKERAIVDEILYTESLNEAKQKQEELKKEEPVTSGE